MKKGEKVLDSTQPKKIVRKKKIVTVNEQINSKKETDLLYNQEDVTPEYKRKKYSFFVVSKVIRQSVLVVLGIALGVIGYHQLTKDRDAVDQKKLLSDLAEVIILPTEEGPSVFDIDDPVLLSQDQDFFVGSVKGDKLVVFPVAGKAIIYRPSKHLIINVGPVFFENTGAGEQSTE